MRQSRHWRERAANSILILLKPGTVLGGVKNFELVAKLPGRFDEQVFVKGSVGVSAVVVLHRLY